MRTPAPAKLSALPKRKFLYHLPHLRLLNNSQTGEEVRASLSVQGQIEALSSHLPQFWLSAVHYSLEPIQFLLRPGSDSHGRDGSKGRFEKTEGIAGEDPKLLIHFMV